MTDHILPGPAFPFGGAGAGGGAPLAVLNSGAPRNALVNARGEPTAPDDIVRRLRQIDERLGIRWVSASVILGIPGHWAITLRWREGDPRYAMIQRGDMRPGSDHDMIGDLAPDCSVEEIPGWFVANVKRFGGDAREIDYLLGRVGHWNDEQEKKNADPLVELAEEIFGTNAAAIARDLDRAGVRAPGATIVHHVGARSNDLHGHGKKKDRADFEAFVRDGGTAEDIKG